MPIRKFWASMAARARFLNRRRGNMGNLANFHSLSRNTSNRTAPVVIIEMAIGFEGLNCVSIPDMGIRSIIVPALLRRIPAQSTLSNLSFVDSRGIVDFGRSIMRNPATHTASGAINQNVPRQVTLRVNPAARNGPMVLPRPTHPPRTP